MTPVDSTPEQQKEAAKRQSIEPTYDSRETGPPYTVTTWINSRCVGFQYPIDDPFVNTRIRVGWRGALRSLLRHGHIETSVCVSASRQIVDDVLELDANTLIPNSTRRDEFDVTVGAAMLTIAEAPDA